MRDDHTVIGPSIWLESGKGCRHGEVEGVSVVKIRLRSRNVLVHGVGVRNNRIRHTW